MPPEFDGTGPNGRGLMTGKCRGYCVVELDGGGQVSNSKDDANVSNNKFVSNKILKINQGEEVVIMPGGNGTGPAGMGSMTGRAAGYCAGNKMPGFANPVSGRGFGGGRGFGRGGRWGHRNMFHATGLTGWQRGGYNAAYGVAPYASGVTQQQELDMLKGQSEYFEDALEGIKKRIDELEAEKK